MNSIKPLSLYRQFFKATQNCKDKNLKYYVRRRIRQQYQNNKTINNEQAIKLLEETASELEIVRRQVALRNLY